RLGINATNTAPAAAPHSTRPTEFILRSQPAIGSVHEAMHELELTLPGSNEPGGPSVDFRDRDGLVTACGRICIYRKKINISVALAGQRLGIKEVDDGIWLVSFIDYRSGLHRLGAENLAAPRQPVGPRLSPMS